MFVCRLVSYIYIRFRGLSDLSSTASALIFLCDGVELLLLLDEIRLRSNEVGSVPLLKSSSYIIFVLPDMPTLVLWILFILAYLFLTVALGKNEDHKLNCLYFRNL